MRLDEKERIEIEYWRQSPGEAPGTMDLANLTNKLTDAPVFEERLRPFEEYFARARRIVELGGGQGWASCLIKRRWPRAQVIATDISPHALASAVEWERIFNIRLDAALACRSYALGLADGSVDILFCFAAAHHFVAQRHTLREVARVLAPGGRCFYFHEPSCAAWVHGAARWRVNRIRPVVPEDVLISAKMVELARAAGLTIRLHRDLSLIKRGRVESLYYRALAACPPLARALPCTLDYEIIKQQ